MSRHSIYTHIHKIYNSTKLLFLSFTFLLTSCGNPEGRTIKKLVGEWQWAYTKGHEQGNTYDVTPKSMNMKLSYVFVKDSVLIFIDGAEHEAFPFSCAGDTLRYGQEEVLLSISKGNDSLFLRNLECCEDVFEKAFVKRHEKH
ncbi:hypothetical protein WIW50_12510 [Flavobacteriaceae bacterium 3-367]